MYTYILIILVYEINVFMNVEINICLRKKQEKLQKYKNKLFK